MPVYLIRHTDALPLGQAGIKRDADRPLSDAGIHDLKALAPVLARLGFEPQLFATSPLKRALQTAELLMEHAGQKHAERVTCEELAPGGSAKKLVKFLRRHADKDVALAGHAPDIAEHTAYLIGDKTARIHFSKGAVACLEFEDDPAKAAGVLCWLITPDLCPHADAHRKE